MINGKDKRLITLSYLTLIVSGLAVLAAFYWILSPFKWITYYNSPFPVHNEDREVRVGEALAYTVDYCRFNDKLATFSKDIISTDGTKGITLPSYTSSFGTNCKWYTGDKGRSKVLITSTVIPPNLLPGEYIMKMTVEQKINPLRTMTLSVESEPFIVIE